MNFVQPLTVKIRNNQEQQLSVKTRDEIKSYRLQHLHKHIYVEDADTHGVVPPWGLAAVIGRHARNIK
jgi:hypothetical protein